MAYFGLFLLALGAATVLPLQSEAALLALLLQGSHSTAWLLAAAILGNTLGSLVNWWLGRSLQRFRERPWFPLGPQQLARTQGWYRRYGRWSLLLSWLPLIGDPLTLVAGVMREPWPIFLLLVFIAKAGRYLLLAALALGWY